MIIRCGPYAGMRYEDRMNALRRKMMRLWNTKKTSSD
jgi:hypothetical protein